MYTYSFPVVGTAVNMRRGHFSSLLLALLLLSFISPGRCAPRGGRGGGGRGGGRGGRGGGGGWSLFGGWRRSSYSSGGSSSYSRRSYSYTGRPTNTTPQPPVDSPQYTVEGRVRDHFCLNWSFWERWIRGNSSLATIISHTRLVETRTRYGTTLNYGRTLQRQLKENKVAQAKVCMI